MKIFFSFFVMVIISASLVEASDSKKSANLFYLHQVDKACKWNLFFPESTTNRELFQTDQCPIDIVWDNDDSKVYFITSKKLFVSAWGKQGAEPEEIGTPLNGKNSFLSRIWIDVDTNKLRIAVLENSSHKIEKISVYQSEKDLEKWNLEKKIDPVLSDRDPSDLMGLKLDLKKPNPKNPSLECLRGWSEYNRYPEEHPCYLDSPQWTTDKKILREVTQNMKCIKNKNFKGCIPFYELNREQSEFRLRYYPLTDNQGILSDYVWVGGNSHHHLNLYFCYERCREQIKFPAGPTRGIGIQGDYLKTSSDGYIQVFKFGNVEPILDLKPNQKTGESYIEAHWLPK